MNKHIDLTQETNQLQVPRGMDAKVSGIWGGITCDLVCRDCPAMYNYMLHEDSTSKDDFLPMGRENNAPVDVSTREMVQKMIETKNGLVFGRVCVGPTKKFLIAGKQVCKADFCPESKPKVDLYHPESDTKLTRFEVEKRLFPGIIFEAPAEVYVELAKRLIGLVIDAVDCPSIFTDEQINSTNDLLNIQLAYKVGSLCAAEDFKNGDNVKLNELLKLNGGLK